MKREKFNAIVEEIRGVKEGFNLRLSRRGGMNGAEIILHWQDGTFSRHEAFVCRPKPGAFISELSILQRWLLE